MRTEKQIKQIMYDHITLSSNLGALLLRYEWEIFDDCGDIEINSVKIMTTPGEIDHMYIDCIMNTVGHDYFCEEFVLPLHMIADADEFDLWVKDIERARKVKSKEQTVNEEANDREEIKRLMQKHGVTEYRLSAEDISNETR